MLKSTFVICAILSLVKAEVTVRGKIRFRDGPPENIPDGSSLTVKLEDTNHWDAPAVHLGDGVHEIKDYKNNNVLTYEIKGAKRPPHGQEASLNVVLNKGWTPKQNSDEWIRPGDFINDEMHSVQIKDGVHEYNNIDIEISTYGYDNIEDEL